MLAVCTLSFTMNLVSAVAAYCFFDNKSTAIVRYTIEDTKQTLTTLRFLSYAGVFMSVLFHIYQRFKMNVYHIKWTIMIIKALESHSDFRGHDGAFFEYFFIVAFSVFRQCS